MSDSEQAKGPRHAPSWLKYPNKLMKSMINGGIAPGTNHTLTVAGRRSGVPRSTPVAVVTVDGSEHIVAGFADSDWVKNVRHAGSGHLRRGRVQRHVALVEVPEAQSPVILRHFAKDVRGGRGFLAVGPDGTDSEFAAAAKEHPVFRVVPAEPDGA
ncbi:MAG TPA: nitroreductase/quinone reductase family protein [Streptosporangiaceae bacterium]